VKAFDLVRFYVLFRMLQNIGCPQDCWVSSHPSMKTGKALSTLMGMTCEALPVSSKVMQGFILAPILFEMFLSMFVQYAFKYYAKGFYQQTRAKCKHISTLLSFTPRSKVKEVLILDMLYADGVLWRPTYRA